MNFTFRQLQYFRAVAEQRNFGRAAQVCHVSQPALSVQIKALEESMGGPLFERQARDILLTPLGRDVLEYAQQVLNVAERLDRFARDHSGGHRSLSIGIIPTVAPYLLPGVLAGLRAADVSLRVQIREARTERLLAMLRTGEIDAAVLALPLGGGAFHEEPLFEDRFLLAGSQTRLNRLTVSPEALRPLDLKAAQLILLEDGHCLTDQALDVCGQDRTSGHINMGASSLATLSRLVAEGFGLTLMPELAAQAETDAVPGLQLLRFGAPQPARTIGLVRRTSTGGEAWFDRLAQVIRQVGEEVVAKTRS
ncbi:LysR family transcriptional regulator, hydrogen peroxide-inducible genes activator [Ruegeria halocynthiae]|uniref:LysR family transcriptional regulator, hydrogen peroxide-inducible genes activator n=1 Tax=Ruegeria halocynthiae TaxID=985054 RepID=A0A1H2TW17_9RHOB|nr:hydrogen peroxide-inducible genes activator [Ruegeria halocynthiae]SDW48186.1 LysR family transcriptional regulator, hydrogen peroxide-inducible genes activator [Ruegeria halocynthiae]